MSASTSAFVRLLPARRARPHPVIRVGLLGCGTISHLLASHAGGFAIAALYDQTPERARELAAALWRDGLRLVRGVRGRRRRPRGRGGLGRRGAGPRRGRAQGRQGLRRDVGRGARRSRLPCAPPRGGDRLGPACPYPERCRDGAGQPQDRPDRRDRPPRAQDHQEPGVARAPGNRADARLSGDGPTSAFRPSRRTSTSRPRSRSRPGREVEVELWADPAVDRNIHEICAEGPFGDAYLRIRNVPSPDNPATSYLAALSILALLRDLSEPIVVGT